MVNLPYWAIDQNSETKWNSEQGEEIELGEFAISSLLVMLMFSVMKNKMFIYKESYKDAKMWLMETEEDLMNSISEIMCKLEILFGGIETWLSGSEWWLLSRITFPEPTLAPHPSLQFYGIWCHFLVPGHSHESTQEDKNMN